MQRDRREIERMLANVSGAKPAVRRDAFEDLVRMLDAREHATDERKGRQG